MMKVIRRRETAVRKSRTPDFEDKHMKIMGILNTTPDSFSDGGEHFAVSDAIEQAEQMIAEGVDIIDIGGESTRPYADAVSLKEEIRRVIPVIQAIRKKHDVPISVDTMKAEVARQALAAGADIINDITALQEDPAMLDLVKETTVPVIIMHMQGTPRTMQIDPHYKNVVEEVMDFFRDRIAWLKENGVNPERITIDPGIGFGKNLGHNLSLLKHLKEFKSLGRPVLLGHSRKRFLADITGRDVTGRDLPTAVVSALALSLQVDIVRVHNVADTRDALKVAQAISEAA